MNRIGWNIIWSKIKSPILTKFLCNHKIIRNTEWFQHNQTIFVYEKKKRKNIFMDIYFFFMFSTIDFAIWKHFSKRNILQMFAIQHKIIKKKSLYAKRKCWSLLSLPLSLAFDFVFFKSQLITWTNCGNLGRCAVCMT